MEKTISRLYDSVNNHLLPYGCGFKFYTLNRGQRIFAQVTVLLNNNVKPCLTTIKQKQPASALIILSTSQILHGNAKTWPVTLLISPPQNVNGTQPEGVQTINGTSVAVTGTHKVFLILIHLLIIFSS